MQINFYPGKPFRPYKPRFDLDLESKNNNNVTGARRVISDKYTSAAFLKYPVCSPIGLFKILYLDNFKVCGNREIKNTRQFIDFSAIFLSVTIVSNARKGEVRSNNTRK